MALHGDTIKLRAEFRTFDHVLIDPANIVLKIYDRLQNQLGESIDIGPAQRVSEGIYEYAYTIPNADGALYYEFTANPESLPAVARGMIERKWI